MTKQFELSREPLQLAQGYNLLTYKRDGVLLNVTPIQEYMVLSCDNYRSESNYNLDLDIYGTDLELQDLYVYSSGGASTATITLSIDNNLIFTWILNIPEDSQTISLPKIPINHARAKLSFYSADPIQRFYVVAKQVNIIANIPFIQFIA